MAAVAELGPVDTDAIMFYAICFALGFIVASLAIEVFEEWIIASDLADRERVRMIVIQELGRIEPQTQPEPARPRELAGVLS